MWVADALPVCSAACKWLGAFLRNSSGGAVIVSHDEDLLQDACDQIVEVRGRQLHHYAGDYALFLEQRELRGQQAASAALTQNKKIAELEGFVARFGAKASKASQAQSRAKVLEKMKSNMVAAPAAASGAGPGDARKVGPWFEPLRRHFLICDSFYQSTGRCQADAYAVQFEAGGMAL